MERKKNEEFKNLHYDRVTNTVHMLLRERSPAGKEGWTYHILHRNDYTWKSIDELGDELYNCWFDLENMFLYVEQVKTNKADPKKPEVDSEGFVIRIVKIFDIRKREFIDCIELPSWSKNILCIYGNPLNILASVRSNNTEEHYHYFVYNTENKASTFFQENKESIIDSKINLNTLSYHIPINNNGCFLGVDIRSGHKSGIVLIDLTSNKIETVALDDFPYEIYNFKKVEEGKYAFLAGTRTLTGAHGPSFLCFLDYPYRSKKYAIPKS